MDSQKPLQNEVEAGEGDEGSLGATGNSCHENPIGRNFSECREIFSKSLYIAPHRRSRVIQSGQCEDNNSDKSSDASRNVNSYWKLMCDSTSANSSGLTEADTIWELVQEMYNRNKEHFSKIPSKCRSGKSLWEIKCHPSDTTDDNCIKDVAKLIINNTKYPYPIVYQAGNDKIYFCTEEGELYELVAVGFSKYQYKFRQLLI